MRRERVAQLTALAILLVGAGCATNPSNSQPTSGRGGDRSGSGGAPRLIGTASIKGAYQARGGFTAHPEVLMGGNLREPAAHDSCAAYAAGFAENPSSFAAPELQTTGSTTIYLVATIASGYHGPGTYTNRSTPKLTGRVAVGVGDVGVSMGPASSIPFDPAIRGQQHSPRIQTAPEHWTSRIGAVATQGSAGV